MGCIRHIPTAEERAHGDREGGFQMKVLLAVDGSDASMFAVGATAALALPQGSSIEVVSVVPDTFAPDGSPWPNVIRADPPTDRDRILGDVEMRLMGIADRIRVGDRAVRVNVLEGRPATEIVLEAERWAADLIVMGARGLSATRRLLIGSVSSEVVDHAPCPVLVARRDAVAHVLWATDGSPEADRAADFMTGTGLFDAADIRVVSVSDAGMAWWAGVSPVDGATSIDIYAEAVELAEKRAKDAADEAADRLHGRRVVPTWVHPAGDIPSTILAEAEAWGADVIVVGARRLSPVRRWLIGSVSRSVLHHAETSVLIVRPKMVMVDKAEETLVATA
jgi:nucleotide-binding universal stress UspA family protein